MTQEEKDLLLVDLSARISYGVKCIVTKSRTEEGQKGDVGKMVNICLEGVACIDTSPFFSEFGNFKPYLFPLTEEILDKATEESNNLYKELICSDSDLYKENNKSNILLLQAKIRSSVIKYFHIHHIDYNGLIEKGLAIDCTNLNIY